MSAPYGWIITADFISDTSDGEKSRVGVMGPGEIGLVAEARLRGGEGVPFRMKDGDGELYYEGRFFGDANSEDAFGPLDDFGTPDAGATSIEYKNTAGGWEAL